jgi:hypothetical protein
MAADENLVVSAFAMAARKKSYSWNIYYPAIYPVNMLGATSNSAFVSLLNDARTDNKTAGGLCKEIETLIATLDENMAMETDAVNKEALRKRRVPLSNNLASLQSVSTVFTQFETSIMTMAQDTKVSMLIILLQAERRAALLRTDNTYVIKLIAKRSGSTIVKESLFFSAKAAHSGGCQLCCLMFDGGGRIVYSNNGNKYIPMSEEMT